MACIKNPSANIYGSFCQQNPTVNNIKQTINVKLTHNVYTGLCMMHAPLHLIKIKSLYCFATVSVIFVIFYLNNTSYIKKTKVEIPGITEKPFPETTTDIVIYKRPESRTRFILLWTNPNSFPFVYFGEGNSIFKKKKCKYVNCYVTSNRQLLRDYTEYDIVAFNGPQLVEMLGNDDLPRVRRFPQKYVYTNIEAAVNYPICSNTWDNFFNWTWTYKLNSDAVWGYISIINATDHVIGPNKSINWIGVDEMDDIDEGLKVKLASKNKAAAWFASNCKTLSKREEFVNQVQNYINFYNLKIDVYGTCGTFQCPKTIMNRCLEELERNYYFYFAFENAISEDYVTEKVLNALNHYTVPIVFGGADYSR